MQPPWPLHPSQLKASRFALRAGPCIDLASRKAAVPPLGSRWGKIGRGIEPGISSEILPSETCGSLKWDASFRLHPLFLFWQL